MAQTLYHVVLDGRRLGPYDRRTIVGMRVRKTLGSRHELEASDGARLTVAELLHGTLPEAAPAAPEPPAAGSHGGTRPLIQAVHGADLLEVAGRGHPIPPFKGEVEVRVQTRVLRIAGRFRDALAWKEDRVKIPLHDIIHAGLQGSVVELGVRPPSGEGLQRLRLDLRTPEAARELAEGLPHAVPSPGSEPLAAPGTGATRRGRRARWVALAAAAMAALLLAAVASHARAAVVEEVLRVPVAVKDGFGRDVSQEIVVTVWRDEAAPRPYPLLVLNHGRDGDAQGRASMGRAKYTANSKWFAQLGFLVAVPTRVGYGESGGPDVEDTGACNRKAYGPAYAASAQQTVQVLQALRARPDAAQDQAVVVGQSFGGATSIAVAALNPPGVKLAINFAGGAGGNPRLSPQQPCLPASIERMLAGFGATARVPTLWIYTENDMYFGPKYPKEWFDAFRAAGGVGEHVLYPAQGNDGHSLFTAAPDVWRPRVLQALKDAGLPRQP